MLKSIDKGLLNQYKIIKVLHSTTQSKIWEVEQKKTGKHLALKKLISVLKTAQWAQRAYRQIVILNKIKYKTIIEINRILNIQNDIYVFFDFMPTNLNSLLLSKTNILEEHIIYFTFQLLLGIKHLHSKGLLHRQLKTTNVLIDQDCNLKLSGFKMVRTLSSEQQFDVILSEQISSKWSCAPEVLMGSRSYGKSADMWSVGCILTQMLLKKPLFVGQSTLQQLQLIMSFTGKPTAQDLKAIDCPIAQLLISQITIKTKTINQYFPLHMSKFYQLIKGLLAFNPYQRLTAQQALGLSIFQKYKIYNRQEKEQELKLQLNDQIRFDIASYKRQIQKISQPLRIISQNVLKNNAFQTPKSKKSKSFIIQNRDRPLSKINKKSTSSVNFFNSKKSKSIAKLIKNDKQNEIKLKNQNSKNKIRHILKKSPFLQTIKKQRKPIKIIKKRIVDDKNIIKR